jgi:hypothetical protein
MGPVVDIAASSGTVNGLAAADFRGGREIDGRLLGFRSTFPIFEVCFSVESRGYLPVDPFSGS